MDDEQIEEWVEEEKEKLEEKYYDAIEHGKSLQKSKEEYDKDMKNLMKQYEAKYDKMWHDIKKHDVIHAPIDELKKKIEKRKKKWAKEYAAWTAKMHDHHKKMLEDAEKKKVDLDLRWHRFLKR